MGGMDTIEQRLAALERGGRRWKAAAVVAGLALAAVLVAGAAERQPDTLRAKRFEIVGEDGAVVMALGAQPNVGKNEAATVGFSGTDGRPVFSVASEEGGAAIRVFGGPGRPNQSQRAIISGQKDRGTIILNHPTEHLYFIPPMDGGRR